MGSEPDCTRLTGLENIGPERTLSTLLAPGQVNSPTRITLENNEKIRPQLDRENAFARASGGAGDSGAQLSPVVMSDRM